MACKARLVFGISWHYHHLSGMLISTLVNGCDTWFRELAEELKNQLRQFGAAPGALKLHQLAPGTLSDEPLVLYFADGSKPGVPVDPYLDAHLKAGRWVLPILGRAKDAHSLPEPLGALNAFTLEKQSFSALADEILTLLWLGRRRKKVFLSYRRKDSSGVAYQLRDELSRNGFEVFLDECTTPPGVDFQRELLWWLNDADVLLLLASPRFAASRWIRKEIDAAHLAGIGILAVDWSEVRGSQAPDKSVLSSLSEEQFLQLPAHPYQRQPRRPLYQRRLRATVLEEILVQIHRFRAGAIQHRLERSYQSVKLLLEDQGYTVAEGRRFGDLEVTDAKAERSFVRTLPFRPDLDTLDRLRHSLASETGPPPDRAILVYGENQPDDPRVEALDWLLRPTRPPGEVPAIFRVSPFVDASSWKLP